MDNLEAIISRIQKLLKLADRSPSEAEAANAASQAAALMSKYRLEQAEVEAAGGEVDVDPIVEEIAAELGARRVSWKNQLAQTIGNLNHCRVWTYRRWLAREGGQRKTAKVSLHVFGRRGDVQTTLYTVKYLWSEVERLSAEAARAAGCRGNRRWLNSFKLGCVGRLYERVEGQIQQKAAALKAGVDAGSKALVIVARHQQEVDEAYVAVAKERKLRNLGGSAARILNDAYSTGRAAGDSVHLGQARGALGPAQGKLGQS